MRSTKARIAWESRNSFRFPGVHNARISETALWREVDTSLRIVCLPDPVHFQQTFGSFAYVTESVHALLFTPVLFRLACSQ